MKRLVIIILVSLGWLPMAAQLNDTGYYRIKNAASPEHYIMLANNLLNYSTIISTAGGNLSGLLAGGTTQAMECGRKYLTTDIKLVEDANCVNPATILYLKKKSKREDKYDIIGQSTSLLSLTTGTYPGTITLQFKVYADIAKVSGSEADTKYKASVELKASNYLLANLGTRYFVNNGNVFDITENVSNDYGHWYFEPVTSFNVNANLEYKGKYYCTMYTPFAYKLSGQTQKAWVITAINADDGSLTKEEVANNGETVPAGTPVILECSSNVPSECLLLPQGEPLINESTNYSGTNLLKGAYFCNTDGNIKFDRYNTTAQGTINANNFTAYNASTMLVLGVAESPTGVSRLGFFPYTGNKMKGNKVWLDISGSSANTNFTFDPNE